MSRPLAALGATLVAVVGAVLFLWPAPRTGSEPIVWGRDTCAHCRMLLSQPGFAAEIRDRDGTLHTYDDVGCLLDATTGAPADAWVEDHASGTFVPLPRATLVRVDEGDTPMSSGLVAFARDVDARVFAAARHGTVVDLETARRERARRVHDASTPVGSDRKG